MSALLVGLVAGTAALFALAGLGGLGLVWSAGRARTLEDRASWAAFAQARGLACDGSIHGQVGGLAVRVDAVERVVGTGRRARTVTATRFAAAVPPELVVADVPCSSPDAATGDPVLDRRFTVRSGRQWLGAEARAALLRLENAGRVSAAEGWLALEVMEAVWSEPGLAAGLDAVLGAARAISVLEALGRVGLAELALRDPSPEVRWRAALLLLAEPDALALEAAGELRHSPVTAVRCTALLLLGEPGSVLLEPEAPERSRAAAVAALDPSSETDLAAVIAALDGGTPAADLLAWVARHEVRAAGPSVVRRLAAGPVADRAEAARAALVLRPEGAEAGLIAALAADEPARSEAARSLGGLGSSAAVPALEPWTRPTVPEPMRSTAAEALRRIRSEGSPPDA